jgi:hypothetical protein
VRNTSSVNQSYVLYRPATLYRGTFDVKVCGAPYNDGSRVEHVTGRYATISPLAKLRRYLCGTPAGDRWERSASSVGCA